MVSIGNYEYMQKHNKKPHADIIIKEEMVKFNSQSFYLVGH